LFFIYLTNINIAPSIPDDSTADIKLNKILFSFKEAPERFTDCSFKDLLRPLPDYTPISVATHSGKPQNLNINRH
jgi:hypothetical protein